MDWDKLRIFHAVAEAGSFTHAGEQLNLSQSAISRQIGALEEQLGVMLFHRHARGLILTEQGELLYRTAREMAGKVATAEALLHANQDKPVGRLKITATVGFGSTWLTTQIHEFVNTYPEIDVSLILSDNELDLGMREADVALRLIAPRQPGLVQRHLMTVHSHVYASQSYVEKYGKPLKPADLDNHRLIVFGEDARAPVQDVNWLLTAGGTDGKARKVVLRVNNTYGIFRAVENGLGIASLADYLARQSTKLVQVLPELAARTTDVFFTYPEELRHSKRIAVFRDFLLRKVAETRF
ncbi:MAG: LysR family transcriptional regulator [Rhodospirillales bacterium]|nr:MAG: LysR family transcriptional regulator [Rhodospirillales bacterium]